MSPMLDVSCLTAAYGAVQALTEVSLQVMPGEIVTLIGANGAGKSTLLMSICGDPKPRGGSISLDGAEITGQPTHAIMRRGVAQSPEGRRIFPRMSVQENLLMGAQALVKGDPTPQLEQVFTLFPRLKERIGQRGGTLSGGEQQMLAIGRALMSKPRLLLLDEPSLGLAPLVVRQIFGAIRQLNESTGLTVLLVEQNANQALAVAHRGYVLETGTIPLSGPAAELRANPEVQKAYLGHG